ncbi:RNA polymerase sigma factor [Geotalea uraniireducens]|uniref:RNA polymerase, sigma subunit, ECF family n=1 Tax=Geotalea uraniireducens (strain Rf4) TaxID=351605 RepID=A5GDP2_GEOUR|nr:RNA polymerase sigma factor [Geotalea uraniireducens]ABQ24310.1 RNA polymerase, sigma subunit, ECF family [Geotalea uraniireducens Rf4]
MSDNLTELFDRLYRDNQAMVYKLALGLTGNGHDAEEITQEAFSRAFRSYHTFREECSFSTWIYRITINVANDYLKLRAKFPVHALTEDLGYSLEEIIDPDPANNPETELLAYQARAKCLHAMTECLPTEQRKVFCLAITLGLPHKLVAEILDCSLSSVKTTLHRAKKRWFGYMEDRCQLIRKSNPCSCKQWVRFGLSQGWISKQALADPRQPITAEAREEVARLKALRDIYQDLYRETADASYAQRIREGIQNSEWAIFS